MRRPSLFLKALHDQRWQVGGLGCALAVMAAVIVLLWPAYEETLIIFDLPPAVEALLGNDLGIATAAGFLSAQYFLWIPALLIVYAVVQGTAAIAGEESSGTIDLLLSQPLARRALIAQKSAAALVGSMAIVTIGYVGFLISIPFVSIDVTLSDAFVATANLLPITLVFFALSLWLGAVMPARTHAASVATGVAALGYFANTLAVGIDALSWLRYASPFYYYGAGLPLVEGIDWAHVGVLLGVATLFVGLSLRAFEGRDVTIGGASGLTMRDVLRRAVG